MVRNPMNLRGALPTALVFLIAAVVLFSRAQVVESSFEEPLSPAWIGPDGGGAAGGHGRGQIVVKGDRDFVRTGDHALRLEVWDEGSPESVAWAGVMRALPCLPSRRVRVGGWVYASSKILPLHGEATAQLKIEYFEDSEGQRLIAHHVFLSRPFTPSSLVLDSWQLVEAIDRAPGEAHSLRFSFTITGQKLQAKPAALWLDDLFARVEAPSGKKRWPSSPGWSDTTGAPLRPLPGP